MHTHSEMSSTRILPVPALDALHVASKMANPRRHSPKKGNALQHGSPPRIEGLPERTLSDGWAARGGRIAGPFFCSDEAAFITGVDYPLDGGFLNLHG